MSEKGGASTFILPSSITLTTHTRTSKWTSQVHLYVELELYLELKTNTTNNLRGTNGSTNEF